MSHPPKIALQFLRWYCREDRIDEVEGDLVELFCMRTHHSHRRAQLLFFWDVIRSFRWVNIKKLKINYNMVEIINYIKIFFRRFRIESSHYLINTLGMALGFAVFLLIVAYVSHEENIDHFHSKSDRIYRVLETRKTENGLTKYEVSINPLAAALKADFPEVEESARMVYMGSSALKRGDALFGNREHIMADPAIFNILDFEIIQGDPKKRFNGPIGIVLSEYLANILFGNENPVGQTVEMTNWEMNAEILAVYKDMPDNSTYRFDGVYVANFDALPTNYANWFNSWEGRGSTSLVLLKEQANPQTINNQSKNFLAKYLNEEQLARVDFELQAWTDLHLQSGEVDEMGTEPIKAIAYGNQSFLNTILIVGYLVLFIAALNYINLNSVQALKRSKEAGIRKVNGATISQLRMQLYTEAFLTMFIAYGISIGLVAVIFPYFNIIAGKSLSFPYIFSDDLIYYHLAMFAGVWLFSGLIPSLNYASISRHLSQNIKNVQSKGGILRKSFVAIQYAISLVLIIATVVLFRQMQFVQQKDLGFDREKVITLDINSGKARSSFQEIINTLESNVDIEQVTTSSRVPGEWKAHINTEITTEGGESTIKAAHYAVDHKWLDVYNIQLSQGSNFSGSPSSDTLKMIINEKAAAALGLTDPVGTTLSLSRNGNNWKFQVIGITENFHFESLRNRIEPIFLTSWNNPIMQIDYFNIKYRDNVPDVVAHIEKVQSTFDPKTPAEINFLDDRWNRYYKADNSRSDLIMTATVVSIFISLFGLFGLVNFTAERKTKEIGIRKVLGASLGQLFALVLKDYLLLLCLAFVIAAPVSWYLAQEWLSSFAYRISLSPLIFMIAFVFVVLISLATVIFRIYRLAIHNPVQSLRYE